MHVRLGEVDLFCDLLLVLLLDLLYKVIGVTA